MCEALKELFKEELEQKWNDGLKVGISQGTRLGVIDILVQLVREGLLSLSVAAERAQMTTEEFQKQL